MKLRRKKNLLEAIQWTGGNFAELATFIQAKCGSRAFQHSSIVLFGTPDGDRTIGKDQWLVVENGRVYTHPQKEFDALYEPVKVGG